MLPLNSNIYILVGILIKMEEMDCLSILGLNKYERQAYLSVVNMGTATAHEISRKSYVPSGKIYEVMNSLHNKGLVHIIPEKVKKFKIQSSSKIGELINLKKKQLQETEQFLETLHKTVLQKNIEPFVIINNSSKEDFRRITKDFPLPKEYVYSIKLSSSIRSDWIQKEKSQIKRGIDVKNLVINSAATKPNLKEWLKVHKNHREFNENPGVLMSLSDDSLGLITCIKSGTAFIIRDQIIISFLKQLFLKAYQNAESIKFNSKQ